MRARRGRGIGPVVGAGEDLLTVGFCIVGVGEAGNVVAGVGGSSGVTTGTGPGGGVVTGSCGVMLCGTVVSTSAGGVGIAVGPRGPGV